MTSDALTRPGRRALPDLEAEQEVDFGRYWRTVAARWWLVAAAAAVGILVGYLLSLGGGSVYRAKATLYLGQPASTLGGGSVQSLASNPSTVGQIARSESVVREVAAEVGIPARRLRRGISTAAVAGAIVRLGQNPLAEVSVRGPWPDKTAEAANLLAEKVVAGISGYVDGKIEALETALGAQERELAAIDRRIAALEQGSGDGNLSSAERLSVISLIGFAEQRRGQVLENQVETRKELSFAEGVEQSRVITPAVSVKVNARSSRSSIVVGGFLGLLAGIALALLWDPITARRRRAPA